MASKIDFNLILAKADKNSNKANKLLEEKKLLNQKTRKPSPPRNSSSKQSALAFIQQKKEEIRKRNEQEARELLEKKQKKDAIANAQSVKKTSNIKKVSDEAVKKYLNSKNGSNNNLAHTHANKKIANENSKKSQKTPMANSKITTSKSYYDQVPSVNPNKKLKEAPKLKPPIKALNQISKPEIKTAIKKPGSGPPKVAMSYDQILKMAENCHKDRVVNKSETKPESDASKYLNSYYGGKSKKTDSSKSDDAFTKKNPSDTKSQIKKSIELPKSSKSQLPTTAKPISAPVKSAPAQSGISAWDRIVSDMKKKPVKKPKLKEIEYEESNYYDDYEEEEYDSEMDDFIDDESVEEEASSKKYSKVIQQIFKYDPKRYKHINLDDVDDMETDYHSQMKEETQTLRMGIKEDLEELKREAEIERKKFEKQKKRKTDESIDSNIKKLKSNKT